MTREVPLGRGFVALVDDADYALVTGIGSWHSQISGSTRTRVYARSNVAGFMHRFLTGWAQVDHINGDGLDNRRSNLRPAVGSQNNHNVKLRRDNTSGFKGVVRCGTRWKAQIKVEGRSRTLGRFATAAEAARIYDKAAREIAGEYARLNFPGPGERGVA